MKNDSQVVKMSPMSSKTQVDRPNLYLVRWSDPLFGMDSKLTSSANEISC